MDDQHIEALSLVANGIIVSYVMLVKCLKNNGALAGGQLENALRKTITAPGAARDRLDYEIIARVLAALEGRPPPELRLILGGKKNEQPQ